MLNLSFCFKILLVIVELGYAKSLQIFSVEKITSPLLILPANDLPIFLDAIYSIVHPNQVLFKIDTFLMVLKMVFLSGIYQSYLFLPLDARFNTFYSSNYAMMILLRLTLVIKIMYIRHSKFHSSEILLIYLNFAPKAGLVRSLKLLVIVWFFSLSNMYKTITKMWYWSYRRNEILL